jgi:hypothetical protein
MVEICFELIEKSMPYILMYPRGNIAQPLFMFDRKSILKFLKTLGEKDTKKLLKEALESPYI